MDKSNSDDNQIEKNIEDLEKELKDLLIEYSYSYDTPKDRIMIPKILDMFKNKIIDESCEDDDYLTYKGFYYNSVENNKKLTLKNYKLAIKKGNMHAMYNLAQIYEDKQKYDEMKKLFLMGIEKGDIESMISLGHFFYRKKEYNDMKIYFNMAIEKGNSEAIIHMGNYYKDIKNNEEALKFYNIAIEKQNYRAYFELALFYEDANNFEESKKNYILYLENEKELITKTMALIQLINYVIEENEDPEFLIPYCNLYEIDTIIIDDYKIKLNQKKKYMINKKKYTINDTCKICFLDKELIIFDCFADHYLCESCYYQIDICPYCKISKHQLMINNPKNNNLDDEEDSDDFEFEEDSEDSEDSEDNDELYESDTENSDDDQIDEIIDN